MPKFQLDTQNDQLWYQVGKYFRLVPNEQKFLTQYSGVGFRLDPAHSNHWITFTFYLDKICVFYKQVLADEQIIYYRRDLNKNYLGILEFELTNQDQVSKVNGQWIKSPS